MAAILGYRPFSFLNKFLALLSFGKNPLKVIMKGNGTCFPLEFLLKKIRIAK